MAYSAEDDLLDIPYAIYRCSFLFGAARAVVFRSVRVAYTFLLVLDSPGGEFKR